MGTTLKRLEIQNKDGDSEYIVIDDNLSQMSYLNALPMKAPTDQEMSKNEESFDFERTITDKRESHVSLAPQESSKQIDSSQEKEVDFFRNDTSSS